MRTHIRGGGRGVCRWRGRGRGRGHEMVGKGRTIPIVVWQSLRLSAKKKDDFEVGYKNRALLIQYS